MLRLEIGYKSIMDEGRGHRKIYHPWWWEHNTMDMGGTFEWPRGVMVQGITYKGESSKKYDAMLPAWGT